MVEDKLTVEQIAHPHDVGYKRLLSSKKLFLELLQSFIHEGWVECIDENQMLKVDKSYVTPDFMEKEADLVYRLRLKDQEVVFYLLMELQSTVDFSMPFRLLSYMMEIWRDSIQMANDESGKKGFRLPAIVPVVLYNGQAPWTAQTSFREMLSGHEELGDILLDFSYFLIDVNRYTTEDLKKLSNLIGAIFILDQKYDIIEMDRRVKAIVSVLQKLDSSQFQLFTQWFGKIVCMGVPDEDLKSVMTLIENVSPEEVEKVMVSNLGEALKKARDDAAAQAFQQGMEKGIEQNKIAIAKNLLRKQLPIEFIAEATGLSAGDIEKLRDR